MLHSRSPMTKTGSALQLSVRLVAKVEPEIRATLKLGVCKPVACCAIAKNVQRCAKLRRKMGPWLIQVDLSNAFN